MQHSQEFYDTCNKIESDKNYKPTCTLEQLFDTSYAPQGSRRLAITPDGNDCVLGRIYLVSMATYNSSSWKSEVYSLLVRYNGSTSFHAFTDQYCNGPEINNIKLDSVLNQPCFHNMESSTYVSK